MTPGNTQDVLIEQLDGAKRLPIALTDRASRAEITLSARALLIFVFLLLIFMLAARPIVDPDFWWHLKTGQYLVQTGSIPHVDIFSAAFAGKEWVTHEWLSEVFIYLVYRAVGYAGLIVAFALFITAGFAVAYRQCAQKVAHAYVSGFALLLGALAAAPTWGVRPQVFSFLLTSIFLALLNEYQAKTTNRSIWLFVPLMIIWVNAHAGFALGLALILLTIIGLAGEGLLSQEKFASIWRRIRMLSFVLAACVAAVSLNPNGVRLYSYPFETLTSQAMMKYIEEWRSPNFHELMFQPLALLILLTFAALAVSSKRIRFSELLLLMATAFAALRSGRNAPFFVLVAMPLLAEHSWVWLTSQRWGQWLKTPEKHEAGANARLKIVLNVLLLVFVPLILAVVRVHRTIGDQTTIEAQNFPATAVDFMRARRPPQPIYNEYGWGGYLIWQLPEYRVYIDGRADVYGDVFMKEFLATHDGETNWKESLNHHNVRTVLIKPDCGLASLLRQEPGWQKIFEDGQAVIFTR